MPPTYMSWLGIVFMIVGIGGYVLGVGGEYPGRAFSITLLMAGITIFAMARSLAARHPDPETAHEQREADRGQ